MKKITLLVALFACSNAFASPSKSFWSDIQSAEPKPVLQKSLNAKPALNKRSLMLNEQSLKEALMSKGTALSSRAVNNKSSYPEVDLPLPDGSFARVRVIPSSILAPAIAEQYPDIKTWRVEGVDGVISGRLDFTSAGFHGMLIMPDGDTVYIDPDKKSAVSGQYQSLSKFNNLPHFKTDFECNLHDKHLLQSESKNISSKKLAQLPALNLITYRLALAGTGEYTTQSPKGTQASAYASMITTINRVNEIYQRDLGIKLELVTGSEYAYLDSGTDPYTNNDANALVSENITNFNNTKGAGNYDIGHVFAQGPLGGLAYVGATCLDNYKAGGATGITDPHGQSEIFSIEFVAHEMGHQMGATHTFNSEMASCAGARSEVQYESTVEPGSGSTIMSYSGLCDTDNIQNNSDATFHWKSIDEMNKHTRVDTICGVRTATGNQNPVADAGVDIKIPVKTPFVLDGSATELEATDTFTYSWDQMDAGTASTVSQDKGDNAIIRNLLPSLNEDRYIPRLSDLFAGTSTIGEMLPQAARALNFAYVVRDGNGGVDTDLKLVNAYDTGQVFRVSSHAGATTISAGEKTDVSWNVAGTNGGDINCSNVDISLIRDNGDKAFLLENTSNDGAEQQVTVPPATAGMDDARIMVMCSDKSFFQISSGDVTILDTQAPVIIFLDGDSVDVVKGTTYTDAGISTEDNTDGNGSAVLESVELISSDRIAGRMLAALAVSVDTSVLATYKLTYSAIDVAGNKAFRVRIVKVIPDTTPPVISVSGANPTSVNKGTAYVDAGATAVDAVDGNVVVTVVSTVNTSVSGNYTVTYTATDAAGNSAPERTRTVEVVEATAPSAGGGSADYLFLGLLLIAFRKRLLKLNSKATD